MSTMNIATRIANAVAANNGTTSASTEHKPILAERFKTKMCQNFEKTGVCPYETRCMFAHGEHDLRTKEMNLAANLVTEEAIKNFQRERVIAEREATATKTKGGKKVASPKAKTTSAPAPAPVPLLKKTAAAPASPVEKRVAAPPAPKAQPPAPLVAAVVAPAAMPELPRPVSPASDSPSTIAAPKSPRASPTSISSTPMKPKASSTATTPARRYRHDPYAPVVIGMPAEPTEIHEPRYDMYTYYEQPAAPCMCADCVPPQSGVSSLALVYKQAAAGGKYSEPCYCADCCGPEAHHVNDQILLC